MARSGDLCYGYTMMIRALTVSLLLTVFAAPAYAQVSTQTNPNTQQTDRSEEDYRNSRKKRDSGDIFDDLITNPNSTGSGGIWGGEVKAIDRLPADSRRHLNKRRAVAMAGAGVGEPIDAAYEPSAEAKTDPTLEGDERAAWEEMMEEANAGLGANGTAETGTTPGQGPGSGSYPSGQDAASQDAASQGAGQAGGQSASQSQTPGQGSGQTPATGAGGTGDRNSPLRGGSSASASDILGRIKGRAPSGAGTAAQGQTASGQGAFPTPAQGQSQGQNPSQTTGQNQGQSQSAPQTAGQADAAAQAQAQGDAQSQDSTAATEAAATDPSAGAQTAAQAAAHAETMSPLERLKTTPVETKKTGGQSSASDYLKSKR